MLWMDRAFKLEVNGAPVQGYSAKKLNIPSASVGETPLTAQVHDKSPQRPQKEHMTWVADQHNYGYGWAIKNFTA